MKKGNIHLIIIATILFSIINYGCTDSKSRSIIGVWEIIPLTESTTIEKWSFFDGNQVYVEVNSVVIDTADYNITTNALEYFVVCEGFIKSDKPEEIANSRDGKYRIDQLDSRFMRLHRISNGDGSTDAAFRYFDFQRSN